MVTLKLNHLLYGDDLKRSKDQCRIAELQRICYQWVSIDNVTMMGWIVMNEELHEEWWQLWCWRWGLCAWEVTLSIREPVTAADVWSTNSTSPTTPRITCCEACSDASNSCITESSNAIHESKMLISRPMIKLIPSDALSAVSKGGVTSSACIAKDVMTYQLHCFILMQEMKENRTFKNVHDVLEIGVTKGFMMISTWGYRDR